MILHCQQMHCCYYLHGCSKKDSTEDEEHGEVKSSMAWASMKTLSKACTDSSAHSNYTLANYIIQR